MPLFRSLLLLATLPATLHPQTEVRALVQEFDRLAGQPLWPGFTPATTPIAFYAGDTTWLMRHPEPPAAFKAVPSLPGVLASAGQHPAVRANSHVELDGVPTATVLVPRGAPASTRLAGTLIHEAFHVYQARHHPRWVGNEAEYFTYPMQDTILQRLQRLETEAWRRSTLPHLPHACWAGEALRLRRERFDRLAPGAIGYERGNELNESLATYVEYKATRAPIADLVPAAGFPPDAVRLRAYSVGPVLAFLLDRHAPGWPARLNEDTLAALDGLLEQALPKVDCAAGFTPAERDSVARLAAGEVAALLASRDSVQREFHERKGWRLTIEAGSGAPLWPERFDPWNITPLDRRATLHRRWVKLANAAGGIEVLGREALTIAAGEHPLFEGVALVGLAGLASLPAISEDSGAVTVAGPGITARFRAVRVDTLGRTVTVRLGATR